MIRENYQELAARTINERLYDYEMETHALHGMASEIGEISEIYRDYFDGCLFDNDAAKSELGDLIWFGQLGNIEADGPLSLDVAMYKHIAEHKKVKGSAIAGEADCMLFPNIESGNVFFKMATNVGGGDLAAMVVGSKVPCVLTSRGDSSKTKLYSIALACLSAK